MLDLPNPIAPLKFDALFKKLVKHSEKYAKDLMHKLAQRSRQEIDAWMRRQSQKRDEVWD